MPTDVSALFDVSHVRSALQRRMASERFRTAVKRRLKQLGAHSVVDDADGTAIEDAPKRRRLGFGPKSSTGPTLLSLEVQSCVASVKSGLPPKPWHSTLQFVSYDLPTTSTEFSHYMKSFIDGDERSEGVRAAILDRNPSMRSHPDTAMFMEEVILPFRSYLMAQIIISVLQLSTKRRSSSDSRDDILTSSMKAEDEAETSRLERVVEGAERTIPQYANRLHAALHAVDMDDVDTIDSFLPDDAPGLRRFVANRKHNGCCTRYAEYHLLYMTLPDGTDDREWLLRMKPLAEEGLAHAQVDTGLCCLSIGRIEEGREWLERASKCQCTTAMLALGRHYFDQAMGWTKVSDSDERTVEENVKAALRWLDMAADGPLWDASSARDKAEAQQLIRAVEQEAKRFRDYKRAKEFLAKQVAKRRRWQLPLLALVVLCVAFVAGQWWAAYSEREASFGEGPVAEGGDLFASPHRAVR